MNAGWWWIFRDKTGIENWRKKKIILILKTFPFLPEV
jgi:hypothetical protein